MKYRYRWPRGARGTLHLKGTPAEVVSDSPGGPKRTVPGRRSCVAKFGKPAFEPNIFETDDEWVARAIQATKPFTHGQIVVDGGKPAPPAAKSIAVPASDLASVLAADTGTMLPDEEPEWGGLTLADLQPVAGLRL